MSEIITTEYKTLLSDIKLRIRDAQYQALKAVNKELITLYWDIGQMIVEKQKGETWGKSVVENLAQDLQNEFHGMSGFSASNLWRMKFFYESYQANEILAPLVREIGWSHNIYIFERCKDDLEREFYIRWTKKFGWTKAVLLHQIQNKTYEKTLLNQTNFDKTVSEELLDHAKLAVKDEYMFDFLELGENYKERELERSLIARVEDFLREMGGLFAFVGSQYHLEVDEKEFFIDLLLYHRRLRCLVAIDLKIGDFQPEHVGKMQFYLAALDDLVKMPDENASIGLILCQSKTRTIVEYALRESNKPIGISQYKIISELPNELKGELPDPEQIAKLLRGNN
jgi:predicted nuclease of restriction endonuclease-like (RecB) superfamily